MLSFKRLFQRKVGGTRVGNFLRGAAARASMGLTTLFGVYDGTRLKDEDGDGRVD